MATGIFRFLCFFDLAIPNDYGFCVKAKERQAFIRVSSQNGQKIFSFIPHDYKWLNTNNEVQNYFIAAVLKDGTKKPFRRFSSYKEEDSFSGGIVDDIPYNIIDVIFHVSNLTELSSTNINEHLKDWVLSIIDNFIDLYKCVTQDSTINKSLIYKSPIIQVLGSEETLALDGHIVQGTFKILNNITSWDNPVRNGYIKKPCSEENMSKIGQLLNKGHKLQMFEEILLQSKDQCYIYGNYSLSVVLSETAFEVYIQHALMEYCSSKGIKELPIRDSNKKKNYEKAITEGNIRSDLFRYINSLTGDNITQKNKYYQPWLEKAYNLRIDIVHKGRQDISETDADMAFGYVVKFINYIEQVLHHKD